MTPPESPDLPKPLPNGRKDDRGKRRFSLLPIAALGVVVDVLEYGARKYAPDNWMRVPNPRQRYFDAAQRHLWAWWGGERDDAETGLPHLASVVCCALFLLHFEVTGWPAAEGVSGAQAESKP